MFVKVIYLFFDTTDDGGGTGVVPCAQTDRSSPARPVRVDSLTAGRSDPSCAFGVGRGTHRIPDTPPKLESEDGTRTPEAMPGHVKFGGPACPAGTAVLFVSRQTHDRGVQRDRLDTNVCGQDTRTWHCGMPNTSADERRGIIINYGSFHFKQTGVVQESAQALERRGCPLLEDPETRQLLGLSAVNGTNRYDSAYVRAHPMPDVR